MYNLGTSISFSILLATGVAQAVTPVVVFPGWHATKLVVTVDNQTAAPECPASGMFEHVVFQNPPNIFSQVCKDKLMTLRYNGLQALPMSLRFSEQFGVTVAIKDYGKTESSDVYEPIYALLELNGYTRNVNIRVAGYDSRLTPDIGNFLQRTVALIEQTYADNWNTPVHLVAHSGGPMYAHYLLAHTSHAWKNKYIHGFTSLAGSYSGQGFMYSLLFTGLNVNAFQYPTDVENATSSALMYQSHPSTYMIASDPKVFKDSEVVVQAGSTTYTPRDYRQLFHDSGLTLANELGQHYIGFLRFREPPFFPNVDVYADNGSGLDTVVGLSLPDLQVGQLVTDTTQFFVLPGDNNQESITNDSVRVWSRMKCFRFEFTDNPGVGHMDLVSNAGVHGRLLANLQRPRSECH